MLQYRSVPENQTGHSTVNGFRGEQIYGLIMVKINITMVMVQKLTWERHGRKVAQKYELYLKK